MKKKNLELRHDLRRLTASFAAALLLLSVVSSAETLVIPGDVVVIEASAFEGAHSLTVVEIPESVKTIGSKAFANCDGITDIYVLNRNVSLGDEAFGTRKDITLHAPMGSLAQTYAARYDMKFKSLGAAATLLEYAATQLGTSYSRHDCVTYVHECYRKALNINTYVTCIDVEQKTKGLRIDKITDLQPGDIMCWKNDEVKYCTHVGMYVGAGTVNGKQYSSGVFIESSRAAGYVRYNYIAPTGSSYYTRNFMGAWRII